MKIHKKEILVVFLIFLFGLFLRFFKLDNFPPGLHGDEAWAGIEGIRILNIGSIGIWSPASYGEPALRLYLVALFLKIFGASIISLRASSAFLSLLSIPFFYGICRLLFNKRVAIISLLFFTTSFTILLFSRVAHLASITFPFYPLLFFSILGFKTKKYIYLFLAGLFLGLTPQSYFSLWICPAFLIIVFFILKLGYKTKTIYLLKALSVTFLTAIIVALPIIFFFIENKNVFLARPYSISITTHNSFDNLISNATDNFIANIKMFLIKGDSDSQNNIYNYPLFSRFEGLFLLMGLLVCLRNIKKYQFFLLFFWLLLFLIASSFTIQAPNYRRNQLSITASIIIIAIGIDYLLSLSKKLFNSKKYIYKIIFLSLSIIIFNICLSGILYFKRFSSDQNVKQAYAYRAVKASEEVNSIKPSYVYWYSNSWPYRHETMRFLIPNFPGENRSTIFGKFSTENIATKNSLVVIFPEYKFLIEEIKDKYKNGKLKISSDEDGNILFYSYLIKG